MPENGSRNTACTSSSNRLAVRRLVATQYVRSSMNSDWKTASRCGSVFKSDRLGEVRDRLGIAQTLAGTGEGVQQALGIPG